MSADFKIDKNNIDFFFIMFPPRLKIILLIKQISHHGSGGPFLMSVQMNDPYYSTDDKHADTDYPEEQDQCQNILPSSGSYISSASYSSVYLIEIIFVKLKIPKDSPVKPSV